MSAEFSASSPIIPHACVGNHETSNPSNPGKSSGLHLANKFMWCSAPCGPMRRLQAPVGDPALPPLLQVAAPSGAVPTLQGFVSGKTAGFPLGIVPNPLHRFPLGRRELEEGKKDPESQSTQGCPGPASVGVVTRAAHGQICPATHPPPACVAAGWEQGFSTVDAHKPGSPQLLHPHLVLQ